MVLDQRPISQIETPSGLDLWCRLFLPGIKASGYYTKRGESHVRLVVDIRGEDAKRALELGEFMGDHILVSAIEKEKND